jgi:RNA polymerase sigma-70 factor (ECF subfamily)
VLILREVLAWRAAEVADLLGTTTAAVNSALQRARAQLDQVAPDADEVTEPADPDRRALLDRYVAALENADVAALTQLLTKDVVWEMPPYAGWFTGREAVGRLVAFRGPPAGAARLLPTRANEQPAFGFYRREGDGVYRARIVQVLTLSGSGIARVTAFHDPGLFATFGLPATLPAVTRAQR